MRQLDIFGMHLRDYSLREGVRKAEEYLNNGALNTITYLSNRDLVAAVKQQELHEWIEEMDMTIPGNIEVLKTAGIDNWNRYHEVENDDFFREFMKKIIREHKSVFLISDSEKKLILLQRKILQEREHLEIAGTYLLDELSGGLDSMVNEINDVNPSVIVSCLPFEMQAQYIHEYRKMINADVWLGLLYDQNIMEKKNLFMIIREKYIMRLFHRKLDEYSQSENGKQK